MLGVRDHILYILKVTVSSRHFYLCRKANLRSSTEVTLFIDRNLLKVDLNAFDKRRCGL